MNTHMLTNCQLQEAFIKWNRDDATFRISCPHTLSEEVWEIFFRIARDLIHQESGDSPEDSVDSGNEFEDDMEAPVDDQAKRVCDKAELLAAY